MMKTVLFDGEWGKVVDDCGCEAGTTYVVQCAEHALKDDTDIERYLARHKMLVKAAKESWERHGKQWPVRAVIKTHEDSRGGQE